MASQTNHAESTRKNCRCVTLNISKMLEEQMQQFLFEGAEVAIEGYVPPSKA